MTLTPIQRRMLIASGAIVDGQPDDPLYTHSVLAQTYFPTTKQLPEIRQWQRRQGHAHLKVDAGQAWHPGRQEFVDIPLPYGPKARLILMHLNSEAVRQRSHVIEVDRSMTAFVARVQDRQPNSRDIAMFKSQLSALAPHRSQWPWIGQRAPYRCKHGSSGRLTSGSRKPPPSASCGPRRWH